MITDAACGKSPAEPGTQNPLSPQPEFLQQLHLPRAFNANHSSPTYSWHHRCSYIFVDYETLYSLQSYRVLF